MATIDLATGLNSGLHPSEVVTTRQPYLVWVDISIAAAVTAKGSALAAADIIKAIDIPPHSMVLNAGVRKTTAPTGTVSVATLDLGVAVVDTDVFVDGFDYYAAATDDDAQNAAAFQPITFTAAGTVDLIIATLTGTLLTGTIGVWAIIQDLNKTNAPGLALLRS